MEIASLVLIRKFHTDCFKILLEVAETAFMSGINSWSGLAKVTPFWARYFFFTVGIFHPL